MTDGWIKIHRQIQHNDIWTNEPFSRGQAWVDLILLANHKDGFIYVRGNKIDVKRGQVAWSQKRLSERWQWSRGKVARFLQDLENEGQIEQHKNFVTSLLTITKYSEYQKTDSKRTADRAADGQQTEQQTDTNKNVKNEKNEKNIPPIPPHEGIEKMKSAGYEELFKMEKPLTGEQLDKLIQEHPTQMVRDVFDAMENFKGLTKKYKSTYLTAKQWIKRREQDGQGNHKPQIKIHDAGTY